MLRKSSTGRWVAALTVATAAMAGVGIGAGHANASEIRGIQAKGREVSVNYECLDDDTYWTFQWKIDAPRVARVGNTVTLSVEGSLGTNVEGVTIPAGSTTADLDVNLTGAQTGTTDATGLANPDTIPPGGQRIMTGGVATVKLTHRGLVNLSPGTLTGQGGTKSATCVVVGTAPISSRIFVLP
jgi:hypothetical protein